MAISSEHKVVVITMPLQPIYQTEQKWGNSRECLNDMSN